MCHCVITMAARIGIRELRNHLTATIQRVRAGETIEVTLHGQPVAVLGPVRAGRIGRLMEAEDITPPEPMQRALRRFPVVSGITASQALEDDRSER